jgi:hypothetical protein
MGEPLRDPEGKIIQWYGLSVDIDERKKAEERLSETRGPRSGFGKSFACSSSAPRLERTAHLR